MEINAIQYYLLVAEIDSKGDCNQRRGPGGIDVLVGFKQMPVIELPHRRQHLE